MEVLAEVGPHIVPNRGVGDAIVNQDYRLGPCAALFVVECGPLNLYERSGAAIGCGAGDLGESTGASQ
jgi:hypothetical protein